MFGKITKEIAECKGLLKRIYEQQLQSQLGISTTRNRVFIMLNEQMKIKELLTKILCLLEDRDQGSNPRP